MARHGIARGGPGPLTHGRDPVTAANRHPIATKPRPRRRVLEVAGSMAEAHQVAIEIEGVTALTEDAASLLLFRGAPWRGRGSEVTLRALSSPGRQDALRAYARRRIRLDHGARDPG